jgi:tRNA (guanine37-N1)-methyltransferase
MVLMAGPMFKAIEHAFELVGGQDGTAVVYPNPQGEIWSDGVATTLCDTERIIFICGHYKGIDQRVIQKYVTHEFSIGDFVVSAGELPALLMMDSIIRLVPGVLNSRESALSDSFTSGLLDTPWFTKPREIDGMEVPDTLLSGHHDHIDSWRQNQREKRTQMRRPDLWEKYKDKMKSMESEQ